MNAFPRAVLTGVLALGAFFGECTGQASESRSMELDDLPRFSKEVVREFERIPVQEGGRVKPISTYIQFLMLRINGKRSLKLAKDWKIGPSEWLMYCLFFPAEARTFPVFLVQESRVLDAIGMKFADKKRRDWYSYDELGPGWQKLRALSSQYREIDKKLRSRVQKQVVDLASNFWEFDQLIRTLDFARRKIHVGKSEIASRIFDGEREVFLSEILGKSRDLQAARRQARAEKGEEQTALDQVFSDVARLVRSSFILAIFPPTLPKAAQNEWMSPEALTDRVMRGNDSLSLQISMLTALERMYAQRGNAENFASLLASFVESSRQLADARGEYAPVELELRYYRYDLLTWALGLFLLSFVLVAISWLSPGARIFSKLILVSQLIPLGLLIAAIWMRCIIRSRPPVSTLYETILLITVAAVIVSLVIEWLTRQKIGQAMASILGAGGLFFAARYELGEAVDTMPSLVAVLDTNYYLAIHVTTITLGYSAGLLAAALAQVFILFKLFGWKKHDRAFFKSLVRMVYGVICFGLLLSVVGTILGGVWANDSWGRFWGWDPKENGALLICLWMIFMMHGRLAGILKDYGFCIAAVFCSIVVAFSWWGVNLLGIGLHSYGWTTGIAGRLNFFYGIQGFFIVLGGIAWFLERSAKAHSAEALQG